MLDKILDIIMTILPFFGGRKKRQQMAQEVKEFSELVKEQYGFLMAQRYGRDVGKCVISYVRALL